MKGILKVIVAAMFITGCGAFDKGCAEYTGKPSEVCHRGVVYLQLTSGASVAYAPDGQVLTCNEKE